MRKYFDTNAEAVAWALRHERDGWFTVIDRTRIEGTWFVDTYLVESEVEPYRRQVQDLHPSNYEEIS